MDALKHLIPLVVSGSLGALVLAVGLDATLQDLAYFWRRPKALLRAFIAICVIVPAVAVLVTSALPIHRVSLAGILLMAVAPVPPLVPGKDLKLGGDKAYVYGLYVTFACLAVIIVPITVAIMNAHYGVNAEIRPRVIARVVLGSVLAPLAVGLAIRALWPCFAVKAAPLVSKLSLLLLIVVCIPLFIAAWPAMRQLTGDGTVVAILAIVAAGLAGGHLLGGPVWEDRVALAGAAATRHPGIALLIANTNSSDKTISAAILLFVLVGVVAMIPYQLWVKRAHHAGSPRQPQLL